MTESEKNVAAATAHGWFDIENRNTMAVQGAWYGYPPKGSDAVLWSKRAIPDYTRDLNAVAELEAGLNEEERYEYLLILFRIVTGMGPEEYTHWCDNGGETTFATAEQRVDAYLRLKNCIVPHSDS